MEQSFAGKAYLKINSLVKTPLHEFMAVERSGLWAPVLEESSEGEDDEAGVAGPPGPSKFSLYPDLFVIFYDFCGFFA